MHEERGEFEMLHARQQLQMRIPHGTHQRITMQHVVHPVLHHGPTEGIAITACALIDFQGFRFIHSWKVILFNILSFCRYF